MNQHKNTNTHHVSPNQLFQDRDSHFDRCPIKFTENEDNESIWSATIKTVPTSVMEMTLSPRSSIRN